MECVCVCVSAEDPVVWSVCVSAEDPVVLSVSVCVCV